ncbi:MAG: glycosyltransferase family 39 protein, partial [Deltaproteobacteria bacterium]|nr:glycosyltransferase family 39 protein [Deltaproteobacteria bacterium]
MPGVNISKPVFVILLVLLLAGASILRQWDLTEAGPTTDEPTYVLVGDRYVRGILKGDLSVATWGYAMEHPSVAKWLYGLAFQAQHFGLEWARWYRAPKRLAGLMGTLTVLLVVLIGRRLYGPWTGLWAGAVYALLPHALAHNRTAGLETPTLLFYSAALWLSLRALRPGASRWWLVLVGLSCGL